MNEKQLVANLGRQLASRSLDSKVISALASHALQENLKVSRIDPCIYGICIDYIWDKPIKDVAIGDIVAGLPGVVKEVNIFPHGILVNDQTLMRVSMSM